MTKEKKILVLLNIIVVGFLIAILYHYILGYYLRMAPPFNSFLYPTYKSFCDFTEILPCIKDFAPYKAQSIWISYFPLCYIVLFPFSLIKDKMVAYCIFASIFMTFIISMNIKMFFSKAFTKLDNFRNIFIITFLSYPVLYSLDKGNFDLFLIIILTASVFAFKKEKYMLSAILLAIENAMKPFPMLFLLLFLFKKKYKEFFISIILTGLLIIGGFMVLKGDFFDQIVVLIKNLTPYKMVYLQQNHDNLGLTFTSSLFFPLKWLFCKVGEHPMLSTATFGKFYDNFCNILTIATVFFVWKEKVFWKQITLLTLNMLLTPYLMYDHKLIFLFIPLWLFIISKEKSRFDLTYTILFGLLFIPKNYIFVNSAVFQDPNLLYFLIGARGDIFALHHIHWSQISLSVLLNPLIMLIIMGLIAFEQFKKPKDEPLIESQ